jgi:hypothetical protein
MVLCICARCQTLQALCPDTYLYYFILFLRQLDEVSLCVILWSHSKCHLFPHYTEWNRLRGKVMKVICPDVMEWVTEHFDFRTCFLCTLASHGEVPRPVSPFCEPYKGSISGCIPRLLDWNPFSSKTSQNALVQKDTGVALLQTVLSGVWTGALCSARAGPYLKSKSCLIPVAEEGLVQMVKILAFSPAVLQTLGTAKVLCSSWKFRLSMCRTSPMRQGCFCFWKESLWVHLGDSREYLSKAHLTSETHWAWGRSHPYLTLLRYLDHGLCQSKNKPHSRLDYQC